MKNKILPLFSILLMICACKDNSSNTAKEPFLWGVATAAYQAEGAYQTDGKGESKWDFLTNKVGITQPKMALDSLAKYNPTFKPSAEDLALIASQKPDFLGINYYAPAIVKGQDSPMSLNWLENNPDSIKSNVGPVKPEYLYKILMRLKTDYGNPRMFVTENGTGFKQEDVKINGKINDPMRTDYIKRHIEATLKAKSEGANVKGYVVWSGWDNFEWVSGYTKRLGIIYVDYATQERTPKQSYYWYQAFLKEQKK